MSTRAALAWLLLAVAMASPRPAAAATHYLRVDGGSAARCSGSADAPAPADGSHRACAWRHPFDALPPNGPPRIAGGDTLVIGAGAYMIGPAADTADACTELSQGRCIPAAVPSGPSPQRPTRILGAGHDDGCAAPPQLWASGGAAALLVLDGSANVEVACLELTDRDGCIAGHGDGARGFSPCALEPPGDWGETGIHAVDSRNVLLRDLDIHGMAVNGIRAGRLQDWTLQRVRLHANGWAGWDGNVSGDGDAGSAAGAGNRGHIRFSGVEISWNGCGERYPGGEVFGCWGERTGGYGDGLGVADGGGDWVFEDSTIHHNTSDGLDLLYMEGPGSVTVRRIRAGGNAGNQLKVTGPVLVENSIIDGNCNFFEQVPDARMVHGDHCRARGNSISLRPTAGARAVIRHNTISGDGDCLLVTSHGHRTATVLVQNNALLGGPEWRGGPGLRQLTCAHHAEQSRTRVVFTGNLLWRVKDGFCPPGNICGADPLLAALDHDPAPPPASPLVDAVTPLPAPLDDFFGQPRPQGARSDIGAVEADASPDPAPRHPEGGPP